MTGYRGFVTDEVRRDRSGRRIASWNQPFVGDDGGPELPPHPDLGLPADDAGIAEIAAFLRDKLGDTDRATALAMLREAYMAQDEPNPFPGQPRTGGTMIPLSYQAPPSIVKRKDSTTMDMRTTIAVDAAERRAVQHMVEIRNAEREVEPFVGAVMGCDSASSVCRSALEKMGVDTYTLHPTATKAMFDAVLSRGERPKLPSDSRDFLKRFPEAARIGQ